MFYCLNINENLKKINKKIKSGGFPVYTMKFLSDLVIISSWKFNLILTSPPITATRRVDLRRHNAITIEAENNDIAQLPAPSQPRREEKKEKKLISSHPWFVILLAHGDRKV